MLQNSPLISAETRRSPEIPAIRMFVSEASKKPIIIDPGGTLGKIRVQMQSDRNDATKKIKPNIFSSFGLTEFSVYETRIII